MTQPTLYAIVDIETTGGSPTRSGITDIAIILHDGEKIVETYERLLNPQCRIPRNISLLTGITDEMVMGQPTFEDQAYTIFQLLKDTIFVAHNVNFDYTFIKHHLFLAGYHWDAKKFCTVSNSRKFLPGYPSYSLGNICASLGITISNRHRAMGDASATVILFEKILQSEAYQNQSHKSLAALTLPPHVDENIIRNLPEVHGVYFFHDEQGKIIYVGKANDIKKRVLSHFTGVKFTSQRQLFLRHIHDITYELTGSELMSLLLECHYIKTYWPKYNRALKQQEPKYGLVIYEDINSILRLNVYMVTKTMQPFMLFDTKSAAVSQTLKWINEYGISMKYCKLFDQAYDHVIGNDEQHNEAVQKMMLAVSENKENYIVKLKGRDSDEALYIVIMNNQIKGYQYLSVHDEVNASIILDAYKPMKSNHYMMELIRKYKADQSQNCHNFDPETIC